MWKPSPTGIGRGDIPLQSLAYRTLRRVKYLLTGDTRASNPRYALYWTVNVHGADSAEPPLRHSNIPVPSGD